MISRYSNKTPMRFGENSIEFEIELPKGVVQNASTLVCDFCKERRKGYYVISINKMRKKFVCTEHIIKHNLIEHIEHTAVFKPKLNCE